VLSVGTIQPRKNYGRLALAVRTLVDAGHDIDLVISGREGWLTEQTLAEIERAGLGERLHVLGYVPDRDLPALYATAHVFALVSLYEGFGLPALEAMAAGTPTVVASGSGLPEIVGDAGIVVDPRSMNDIAGAISALLYDEERRAHHAAAGRVRAQGYTWERAAAETEAVFRRALSGRRS
jgi:glycosyltransferase involved in cell wall biosynthesis